MTKNKTAFYAYPGTPTEIAQAIRVAIADFNSTSKTYNLERWEKNDISGIPLSEAGGDFQQPTRGRGWRLAGP